MIRKCLYARFILVIYLTFRASLILSQISVTSPFFSRHKHLFPVKWRMCEDNNDRENPARFLKRSRFILIIIE